MKRLGFQSLLICVIIALMMPFKAVADDYLRGDVSRDGKIDVVDIVSLIDFILNGRWADDPEGPVDPEGPGIITIPMQGGKMVGGYIQGRTTTRSDFFNYRHSVNMIDVEGCTIDSVKTSASETLTIFCYNSSGTYIGTGAVGNLQVGTKFVKLMLQNTSAYSSIDSLAVSYTGSKPTLHKNLPAIASQNSVPQVEISYETGIKSVYPDQGFVADDKRYYDNGFIKLPSNYTMDGTPVPLVVFVHGTNGFPFTGTTSGSSGYAGYYDDVQAFIVRNGYAVCDCSGFTSKNTDLYDAVNMFCTPSFAASIVNMVQFLMRNYNLRSNGIYLYGKSSGGMMVHMPLLVNKLNSLFGLKAIGSLAPAMSPMASSRSYAKWYYPSIMTRVAKEIGVTVNGEPVTFTKGSDINVKLEGEELEAFVNSENIAQWRKIDGFLGYDTSLTDDDVTDVVNACNDSGTGNIGNNATNETAYNICAAATRIISAPLKLWNFPKDKAVFNAMDELYCEMVKAETPECVYLLTDRSTGHHADDQNATMHDYTLPDGTVVSASIIYIDLVEWFRMHDGVANQYISEGYNVWETPEAF